MKKQHEELLEEFIGACGISGNSEAVATVFKRYAHNKLHLTTGIDILGSVVARLNGQECFLNGGYKRKILITAHQDCSNTCPAYTTKNNEFKLSPLGPSNIPNLKLNKSVKGKYRSPGLDNKAGLLSMCILMESLLKTKVYDDIYFVATALGKVGPQGLIVTAEKINPTIAINIDTLKVDKKSQLGKGPIIIESPFTNKKLNLLSFEVTTKYKIPIKYKIELINKNNNFQKVSQSAGGIACFDIRIPLVIEDNDEIVSKKDIENCSKLIHKLCIDINKIESFLPEV